jgi:hypothetical protein
MRMNLRTRKRKRKRVRRTARRIFLRTLWKSLPSLTSLPPSLWLSLRDGFEKRSRYPATIVIVS